MFSTNQSSRHKHTPGVEEVTAVTMTTMIEHPQLENHPAQ
jgi:hypothetical protein